MDNDTRKRAPKANPRVTLETLASGQGISTDPYTPGALTLTKDGSEYVVGRVREDVRGCDEVYRGNAAATEAFMLGALFGVALAGR